MSFDSTLKPLITSWIASETRDLYLPDFNHLLSRRELVTREQLSAFADPFRQILRSEGFEPLLIEISAIQDDRERKRSPSNTAWPNRQQSLFSSAIVSYVDDRESDEGERLIDYWQGAIKSLTAAHSSSEDTFFSDYVPHPATYRHLFLIDRCVDYLPPLHSKTSECTVPLRPEPIAALDTYPFDTPPADKPLCDLAEVTCRLVASLDSMSCPSGMTPDSHTSIQTLISSTLPHAVLTVVPFFRQIHYKMPPSFDDVHLGGNPGGCLIALAIPLPTSIGSTDRSPEDIRLRRGAARVSWLLQQAALNEGDSRMQLERDIVTRTQHILAKLPHATYQPMSNATTYFKQYRDDLKAFFESSGNLPAFTKLSSNLARAQRSINCLDYLVRLDPQVSDPDKLSRKIAEVQKGPTALLEVIACVIEDFRDSWTRRDVEWTEPSFRTHFVEGHSTAWDMVIWLLLKNAGEESGSAPVRLAYGEKENDPNYYCLSVGNRVRSLIDATQLGRMESALKGEDVVFPTSGKPDGLGVGLKTVGQIVTAMGLSAIIEYDSGKSYITITIDGICLASLGTGISDGLG